MSEPVESSDGKWRALAEADGKGIKITIQSLSRGRLFMDCEACDAYHEVGVSCDEAWA